MDTTTHSRTLLSPADAWNPRASWLMTTASVALFRLLLVHVLQDFAGALRVEKSSPLRVVKAEKSFLGHPECSDASCAWTKTWSCPGQSPLGRRGVAGKDGSHFFDCCCTQGLWREDKVPLRVSLGVPGKFEEWQSWSELIWMRSRRFVFCALPKNGCTSWKQLLLRVAGKPHWKTWDSTLIHNPIKSGLDLLGVKSGMSTRFKNAHNVSDIAALLRAGSKVTRAAIVRDPVTRLLSAYLDRCVDNREWFRCFAPGPVPLERVVAGLEEQVKEGKDIKDVHLRPQTDMCGFRYTDYDLIGHMENFTDDSRAIMEKLGIWEDFGKTGWGPDGKQAFATKAEETSNHKIDARHVDGEHVCEHYTPELLRRVETLYKRDFESFGYNVDTWINMCSPIWTKPARRLGVTAD